jgi:uncharacterized membrane protein
LIFNEISRFVIFLFFDNYGKIHQLRGKFVAPKPINSFLLFDLLLFIMKKNQHNFRFWPIFGFVFAFFSCESTPKSTVSENKNTPQSLVREAISTNFSGIIRLADESRTMIDCGSGKTYWLDDQSGELIKKMKEATEPISFENEPIFAKLTGKLLGKSKTGKAASFDNVLEISKIDSLSGISVENSCFPLNFIASGTEPFWRLVISEGLQTIYLEDFGGEKAYIFPWTEPEMQKNKASWICESENAAGERIRIMIKKEKSSDGMSDIEYDFSSFVVIGKKTWSGVARKK